MPFTYAHPAIVLPLGRFKKLSVSAMIIGSLAPDYDYIFRMELGRRFSHEWPGALIYTLPLAFIMYFVFHAVVKNVLIPNSPALIRQKWSDLYHYKFHRYLKNHFLLLVISLSIGILSHIAWDSFTHAKTVLVDGSDYLRQSVQFWIFPKKPLFHYLQHISTLLGLLLIIYTFSMMKKSNAEVPNSQFKLRFWIMVFLVAAISFAIRSFWGIDNKSVFITAIIGAFNYGLIGACLIRYVYKKE